MSIIKGCLFIMLENLLGAVVYLLGNMIFLKIIFLSECNKKSFHFYPFFEKNYFANEQ